MKTNYKNSTYRAKREMACAGIELFELSLNDVIYIMSEDTSVENCYKLMENRRRSGYETSISEMGKISDYLNDNDYPGLNGRKYQYLVA